MIVLVCGDRNWTDRKKIYNRLDVLWNWIQEDYGLNENPLKTTIIHGAAKGADTIAGDVAKKDIGFQVKAFPADWNKHGKSAGPIRNRQMLDEKPDLVIAFHSNIAKSKGTKDCIEEANRRGIKVEIIP